MQNDKADKHYQEGKKHFLSGRLTNAERAFKRAIKINPGHADAYNDLGGLYLQQGRPRDSYNAYRKALKIVPDHPALLNNIGNVLMLQRKFAEARDWLVRAVEKDPSSAAAHYNLGTTFRSLRDHAQAVQSFERAIELNPRHSLSIRKLGEGLVELGKHDEAIDRFNQALELDPEDQRAYLGLGDAYNALGSLDRAVSACQNAISIDPANPRCYSRLGRALEDHGEIERAVSAAEKALEIDPKFVPGYQVLARNRKFTREDPEIEAMEQLYGELSAFKKSYLGYCLGKAYEDIGEYDRSIETVIEAARLRRSLYEFSMSEAEELFEKIKTFFSPEFFERCADSGEPDETPIFILGMPRSGTTLVEQILASHPEVFGAGELEDLKEVYLTTENPKNGAQSDSFPDGLIDMDPDQFSSLGRRYVERVRRFSASSRFITDKMPQNFLCIGLIRAILPAARIIHCTRSPIDNCLSIFKTDFRKGHLYSYDLQELGRYYQSYLGLMEHWKDTLPGLILDISYEELVADQEAQTRRLLEYCDLPWDDACLQFHQHRRRIATASNAQVSRPIYKDSVNRWKRYEKHLEPLLSAMKA